jgi:aryl-alcohol dehydrogenase-like predicted oxidoreductase
MVDTADVYWSYGEGFKGGESETLIVEWTASRKHRDMMVATKVGFAQGGDEGLSAARIERQAEISMKRLQTDCIDLYFAHTDDTNNPLEETLGAFDKLIKAGKVRAIGASNHSAERLQEALDTSRRAGLAAYTVVQPNYSLVSRGSYEGPLRDVCRDNGLGVISYFALASGFLTGKYRSQTDLADRARGAFVEHMMTPHNFHILDTIEDVANESHATMAQVALAWLMAQPTITAPIASATRVPQLEELMAAMELRLSADQIERLDDASTLALAADGGA